MPREPWLEKRLQDKRAKRATRRDDDTQNESFLRTLMEGPEDDNDLEVYRKQAIATLKDNAGFIRDTANDILLLPCRAVYIVGSVLDHALFTEESDIDVAVVVDGPQRDTGMSEQLSAKLQDEMRRYPLGDCGVVNTLVFVNRLKLARGKSLKVAVDS